MYAEDDLRARVHSLIAYRIETLQQEAAEIWKLCNKLPDEFRTPRGVHDALLPQSLGGRIQARLSSYFAVLTLNELANDKPSIRYAKELLQFAEECNAAELTHYFAEKVHQSKRASKPRPDKLKELIDKSRSKNPAQSFENLIEALRNQKHHGVINDIEGDKISWTNGKGEEEDTSFSALKHRFSRANKKLCD